ncbi:MAG: cysteinyl-tRNA synthetase [Saprospiraceae bacterium]|jgi:cysteinyl-tRNA synthetase
MLHIYNTLNRKKELFTPIQANKVGMYVCGMTVYDYCHLGHARVLVVFDMVTRYLREAGYDVNYVRNITDIDDKIIARANENGEEFTGLTERFIDAMHEDERILNVLEPDQEPRATGHIDGIIKITQILIEKGYAYQGANGDVYYRVRQFEGYGKLSGKNVEELRVGARVEADSDKEDPLDFVLWKSAKPNEPFWPSPWGDGRPGWHIECSAMSTSCLSDSFDIHAGGMDLQFPHHENEIAQTEGATGCQFANVWMHNGYVQTDKEKMSKSLGNFFTIREILDQDNNRERMGEVIRFMVLASHYRSPLNYSDDTLANARAGLERLYKVKHRAAGIAKQDACTSRDFRARFYEAMDDDFNTPEAVSVLFDLAREINKGLDDKSEEGAQNALMGALISEFDHLCSVLGIVTLDAEAFLGLGGGNESGAVAGDLTAAEITDLLTARQQAKQDNDWASADRIRDQLSALNIEIEDKPNATSTWRLKT